MCMLIVLPCQLCVSHHNGLVTLNTWYLASSAHIMEHSWKRLAQIQMLECRLWSRYSDCQCRALTLDFTSCSQQDTAFPLGHGVDLLSSILTSSLNTPNVRLLKSMNENWNLQACQFVNNQKQILKEISHAHCKLQTFPNHAHFKITFGVSFFKICKKKIMQCTSVSKLGEGQICCWISDSRKEEDIGLNCCVALYVFPAYCTFSVFSWIFVFP